MSSRREEDGWGRSKSGCGWRCRGYGYRIQDAAPSLEVESLFLTGLELQTDMGPLRLQSLGHKGHHRQVRSHPVGGRSVSSHVLDTITVTCEWLGPTQAPVEARAPLQQCWEAQGPSGGLWVRTAGERSLLQPEQAWCQGVPRVVSEATLLRSAEVPPSHATPHVRTQPQASARACCPISNFPASSCPS